MNRKLVGVMVTVAALGTLVSCGGSKSSSGGGGLSEAAYCERIKSFEDESDRLGELLSSGGSESLKEGFAAMQALAHKLDDNPPSDIADDIHRSRVLIDDMVAVVAKYDYDFSKVQGAAEWASLGERINGDDMTQVGARLDKWGEEKCGIKPDTAS